MGQFIQRSLERPQLRDRSLFLWGPRKTGKSSWLREQFPDAIFIDLLKTDVFAEYAARPALLRERQEAWLETRQARLVVIDEIQKLPELLDEVHWLIENRGQVFVLSGSSARKLRRGHANLLGGRAWRREMRPFCFSEVGAVDLETVMISGLLPPHFLSPSRARTCAPTSRITFATRSPWKRSGETFLRSRTSCGSRRSRPASC